MYGSAMYLALLWVLYTLCTGPVEVSKGSEDYRHKLFGESSEF